MMGLINPCKFQEFRLKNPNHILAKIGKKGALSANRICVHACTDVLEGFSFLDQSQVFIVTNH